MNVLEKIVKEIENIKKIYVDCERDNFRYGFERGKKECCDIIRSHMNEVTKCNECSRRKWYQIGYEDGKKNAGWIPVSEKLPEDDNMRFYMCIVENHEEDLPMFCQYDSEYGFGFWHDIYDPVSLGFLDTEFRTNDELGYEKVIAWQPLPEPYKEG